MNLGALVTSYFLSLTALMLFASAVECLKVVLDYRRILRERATLGESLADFSLPLALSLLPYFVCLIAFPPYWDLPALPDRVTFGMEGVLVSALLVMVLRFQSAIWFPWSPRGRQVRG